MDLVSSSPEVVASSPPAKVRIPDRRGAAVSRRDLILHISTAEKRLVVVTCPAGYGKTTLLVEWASVDEREVVWVSLDPSDDDPVTLSKSIAAALASQNLIDAALVAEMRGPVLGPYPSVVSLLGRLLIDASKPFLLVLDDVHVVNNEVGVELLDRLVDHVPSGSQIVLSGRVEQPFVARRRVHNEIVEVGPGDLVLSEAAACSIFAADGLTISMDLARDVVDRTEGWPAGVYLAMLLAKRNEDDLVDALAVEGSAPFIADYLLQHVFAGLAEEVQEFLLDASVLDEMHRSLCDHALAMVGSQRLLYQLERSNLFVVALDERRDWYRFHALFREFLLSERLRRRTAAQTAELQVRAASWCEANELPEQAVEYLLRAKDVERLGVILTRMIQPAYDSGQATTVERWLREAGDAVIDHYPPLAVLAGWLAAVHGRPTQAEELIERIVGMSFTGPTGDGWTSFAASTVALRALVCADGVAAMNRDAELAVEGAPAWSPWRSTAVWLLGQARELAGNREEAARLYDDSARADVDAGRPPLLVPIAARALLAIDEGDWTTAAARVELALRRAEVIDPSSYIEGAMAHAAAARLALHRHDHVQTTAHLDLAMASRGYGTYAIPHASVRLRASLARVYATIGNPACAQGLLDEIDDIVLQRPDLGVLLDEVAIVRRLIAPNLPGAMVLSPAESRVLGYLPTHLTFAQIGTNLFISRNTVHTHAGSIYRKLGVTSRGEAVERAQGLGLA